MGQENEVKTVRVDDPVAPDAAAAQPAIPCIVHFSGRLTGVTYWLSSEKELIIGRAPEADVCIQDRRVSQRHARVVVSPEGAVFVEDLGSTNGTYVNGKKVTRSTLRDGDKVHISRHYILKFCYEENVPPDVIGRSGADATRDALTGVYARQYLLMRIDEDFIQARQQNEDLALLILAVDDFAKINETHGRNTGNMVLREVAKVVSSMPHREAVLARYENDAFALLLRNLSEGGTVVLAQRIRRAVRDHDFIRKSKKIPVTVSLGIGMLTRNMKNPMDFVREVQSYLDKAKKAGRDTINGSQSIRTIFRQIANKNAA
ncbi:MAG TPA: GGDEF domain-containing protein [Candidatus Methylomirabilis sp.]|nr:GGDEF domain-containing protein [Candidatus Methylomirabilis sp.]